jgi:hypothetical protein
MVTPVNHNVKPATVKHKVKAWIQYADGPDLNEVTVAYEPLVYRFSWYVDGFPVQYGGETMASLIRSIEKSGQLTMDGWEQLKEFKLAVMAAKLACEGGPVQSNWP